MSVGRHDLRRATERPRPAVPTAPDLTRPRTPYEPTPGGRSGNEALVALPDRKAFLRRVARQLPLLESLVVAQIGIDNFRSINGIGPDAGDQVLARVAQLLSQELATDDVVRVGGDCFAVLLPYEGLPRAQADLHRALAAIQSADLSLDGSGIRATASAGLTVLDRVGLTASAFLHEADLAMQTAKQGGRNRLEVYHVRQSATDVAVRAWTDRIRDALEGDGLALHAQPVQSLRNRPEQWELLVRLPTGDGQLMPPAAFFPIAERFGLMHRVDEWVTRRAVRLLAVHAAEGQALRLEVNVGHDTMAGERFTEMVECELRRASVDPASLIFAVNMTAAAAATDDVLVFSERLKAMGCRFALDRFGSSHVGPQHLKTLPLDFVKIDGQFVRHLATSRQDRVVVAALTQLIHGFGCEVIAMGVGDDRSRDLLREMGVDYVQGFHVGRPRPIEQLST